MIEVFELCPLGSAHQTRRWSGGKGVTCDRCHKTWKFTDIGPEPTYPAGKAEAALAVQGLSIPTKSSIKTPTGEGS